MDSGPSGGEILVQKRHRLGMKQATLALRAGISVRTLFVAERYNSLSPSTLMALAKVFAERPLTALTDDEIKVLGTLANASPGHYQALRDISQAASSVHGQVGVLPELSAAQWHERATEALAELEALVGNQQTHAVLISMIHTVYAARPMLRDADFSRSSPRGRTAVVQAWARGEEMGRLDSPAAGDVAAALRPALPSPPEPAAGPAEAAGPALRVTGDPKRYEWVDPATGRRHVMEEHQIHEYHPRAAGSSRAPRAKDIKPKRAPRRKSG